METILDQGRFEGTPGLIQNSHAKKLQKNMGGMHVQLICEFSSTW